MTKHIFIVGRKDPEPRAWEFIGAFDIESDAVAACTTEDHWVAPVEMNKNCETGTSWPGGYYPRLDNREMEQRDLTSGS